MNSWNGLDFLIFLIFAANTILGMSRGATKEIISMMSLSMALIIAIKFTIPLANFLNSSPLMVDVVSSQFMQNFMNQIGAGPITRELLNQIAYSLSLLVCFVGAFSTCEAGLSYTGAVEVFPFPYAALNRKVGAVLGCVRGYVISILFISILTLHIFGHDYNGNINVNPMLQGSFFVNLFQAQTQKFDQIITGQQPDRYREIYEGKDLYKASDVINNLNGGVSSPDNSTGSSTAPSNQDGSSTTPSNQGGTFGSPSN